MITKTIPEQKRSAFYSLFVQVFVKMTRNCKERRWCVSVPVSPFLSCVPPNCPLHFVFCQTRLWTINGRQTHRSMRILSSNFHTKKKRERVGHGMHEHWFWHRLFCFHLVCMCEWQWGVKVVNPRVPDRTC